MKLQKMSNVCNIAEKSSHTYVKFKNTSPKPLLCLALSKLIPNIYSIIIVYKIGRTVRSRNQETARFDLTANLSENQALKTFDLAMKFLLRKFREVLTDWYEKRGIN